MSASGDAVTGDKRLGLKGAGAYLSLKALEAFKLRRWTCSNRLALREAAAVRLRSNLD